MMNLIVKISIGFVFILFIHLLLTKEQNKIDNDKLTVSVDPIADICSEKAQRKATEYYLKIPDSEKANEIYSTVYNNCIIKFLNKKKRDSNNESLNVNY